MVGSEIDTLNNCEAVKTSSNHKRKCIKEISNRVSMVVGNEV